MAFAPSAQRGGLAGTSTASRTMISTTAASSGTIKRFVFGSEWFFKPDGVKSLVSRFEKELDNKQLSAEIHWNGDDHTFRMSCEWATSEQVWGIFFKTAQGLITQESADGWNDDSDDENESLEEDSDEKSQPAQSTKIQHLSEWNKENGMIDTIDKKDEEENYQPMLGIDFPEEVRYYKWKTTWEYQGTSPSLDQIASRELLTELAALVGCEFVKDINQGKIYIGATSEEDCRRAVCKLDNINKNWGTRSTYVKHLFYAEDSENYQVSFKHFIEVKRKFLETTLLDNLQLSTALFDYRNLPLAVTVRCNIFNAPKSRYIPFKVGKYHAAVDIDNIDSGSVEWNDFRYSSYVTKGKEEENSMTRFDECEPRPEQVHLTHQPPQQHQLSGEKPPDKKELSEEKTPEGKVYRWFLSQEQEVSADNKGQPQGDNATTNDQQNPDWDTYKPYTEEQVGARQKKIRDLDAGLSASNSIFRHRATGQRPQAPPTPNLPTYVPQMYHPAAPATPSKATATNLLQDFVTEYAAPRIIERNHANVEAGTLINFGFVDQQKDVSSNILDENTSFFEIPVLQPTRKGHKRSTSPTMDLLPSDPFGSPTRALPSHPVPQFETMQPFNEVSTRTLRSTMNQKAPKLDKKPTSNGSKACSLGHRLERPSPPPARQPRGVIHVPVVDPIPEFIAAIDASYQELLEGVRGFRGELTVQAEFGRILLKGVPRKCITRGESDASFDREYGHDILANPNGIPPMPIFTKVLTAVPADISFLVNMNDRHGHALWKRSQADWDVLYEVLCVDTRARSQPFTIEFGGEKLSPPQVKIRRTFGAINVHGVKRHWDFRITATGVEVGDTTDPAYNELAQAIKGSLHIPEGLRTPLLFFEVPEHLSSLWIFGVRVRRINRYRSTDGKSILSVSEVNELELDFKDGAGHGSTLWKAVGSLEPSTMQGEGDLKYKRLFIWHEVSISCPKADEMFQQNKTLELGEETSWTVEKLSKVEAVQSMYLPACEILKKMDGVGCYNDNEIDARASQSSVSSAEAEPPAPYFFW